MNAGNKLSLRKINAVVYTAAGIVKIKYAIQIINTFLAERVDLIVNVGMFVKVAIRPWVEDARVAI